jgi:hypothetical protein
MEIQTINADHAMVDTLASAAELCADGHYTIMKFSTGYKVLLRTSELTLKEREEVGNMKSHTLLGDAIVEALEEAKYLKKKFNL